MRNSGAIALIVIVTLGLAVAFLSGSLMPRGTIANEVSETTGDAYVCGTSTSVNDPYVDMDNVSIRQVKGGWEVIVSMGTSMLTIFNESFSAAVEVRLGLHTGLYQVHNDVLTINGAVITTEFLIFFFAVLLPLEVDLKVDSFHQAEDGDPVNCDTAFLEDATAGKTTPTATATTEPATTTGTPSTTPGTHTATPSTTPGTQTATPSDTPLPANTPMKMPPTNTLTPHPPPTDTPTPTATPELFKMFFMKFEANRIIELTGWEMKVFAGNGCIGLPIASGLTFEGLFDVLAGFSVELPRGEYSVAETQQPGWERIFPEGTFCQNFAVPEDNLCCSFTNRRIRNGDVNKDGVTNSIDVVLVLQFIAGLIPEQPNTVRADVNEDGMVNAVDTALMLQFEVGLLDSLPVVSDDN